MWSLSHVAISYVELEYDRTMQSTAVWYMMIARCSLLLYVAAAIVQCCCDCTVLLRLYSAADIVQCCCDCTVLLILYSAVVSYANRYVRNSE
jgi:hypothetical protein